MAKRMKLITEADFNHLTKEKNKFYASNLEKKDLEAKTLLETHSIPDDIKLSMYSKLMNSISQQVKEILDKPIIVKSLDHAEHSFKINEDARLSSSVSTDPCETSFAESTDSSSGNSTTTDFVEIQLSASDRALLGKLPERCRRKAGEIMMTLKQHSDLIRWNNNGEVSFLRTIL